MGKNIFEDIKPLTRKDPPLSREQGVVQDIRVVPQTQSSSLPRVPIQESFGPRRPSNILWVIAVLTVGILFFSLSLLFSGAHIVLTPKHTQIDMNEVFEANKSAADSSLPFEIMSVDGEDSKTVLSSSSVDSMAKAQGTVILYNSFSSTSQKLITATRIETTDGKIYRLDKAVTIPGYSTSGGKISPGSIEVTVTADQAGAKYNIPLSDFTITAFKGTTKGDKITVRSKTEMSGGTDGKVYTLSADESAKAYSELAATLKDTLTKDALAQVPKGYLLFGDVVVYAFDPAKNMYQSQTSDVSVSVSGTLTAFIFPEKTFTEALALKAISGYDPQTPVSISNLHDLKVTLQNPESINLATVSKISIIVSGSPLFVWTIDKDALMKELLGVSKKEFNTIVAKYVGIETAELTLKPFWIRKIPTKVDDVTLTIKEPVVETPQPPVEGDAPLVDQN